MNGIPRDEGRAPAEPPSPQLPAPQRLAPQPPTDGLLADVLLADVVEAVGESVRVWAAPGGLRTRLRDVTIDDPSEQAAVLPGTLLLAVGAVPETARALIERAATAGAAGVCVRGRPEERELLVQQAHESGIPLLALGSDTDWVRITGRLRAALVTLGGTPDADEAYHADLVSLANALADAVGGSVVIFSPGQEVLAASRVSQDDDPVRRQAVLDQHGPAWLRTRLRRRGFYRRLWEGNSVLTVDPVPDLGFCRRLAIAIRGGDEILGSIWVAEGSTPLASDASDMLRRAARSAGRYLLRQRGLAREARQPEERLVRLLFAGEADAVSAASRLGVDPYAASAVISWVFPPEVSGHEHRLAELLALHLAAYRCVGVPVTMPGRVDLLVCGLAEDEAVLRLARDITRRTGQSIGVPLRAAVGRVTSGLGEAAGSLADADLILRVLRARGAGPGVVARDEVWASMELLRLTDLLRQDTEPRVGKVGTLLRHDRQHGTAYVSSLAAYLDTFGDVIVAARRLEIHPNTLRYRLRRLSELAGIDLNDPDERLVAALHLRIQECGPGLSGATANPA